jgi:pyruvate,orthophosphate dikinase
LVKSQIAHRVGHAHVVLEGFFGLVANVAARHKHLVGAPVQGRVNGFSRDDIGGFVPAYIEKKLLPADPFQILDREGVGELVELGIKRGRKTRRKLKVGICGEHGGEPSSVEFCHKVGMDYVSCSPFRVPIARLAAAQAQLSHPRK